MSTQYQAVEAWAANRGVWREWLISLFEGTEQAAAANRIDQLEARERDLETQLSQVIAERDYARKMADRLAESIAKQDELDIGEHSNANCPWTNALNRENQEPE